MELVVKRFEDGELIELHIEPKPILSLRPPSQSDLLSLPNEILLLILSNLSAKEVLIFGMVSRYTSSLVRDPALWSTLNARESLLDGLIPKANENYYDLYREKLNLMYYLRLAWKKLLRFTGILLNSGAWGTHSSFMVSRT